MSSIQTGIALNDQFSTVINGIINSVNMMDAVMQEMSQTMDTDIDSSAFDGIRDALNQANMAADKLNDEINNINPSEPDAKQEEFNKTIKEGNANANELYDTFNKIGTAVGSMFAIQKVVGFINDCTDATNTQLNAQTQLAGVLANTGGGQDAYDALVDKAQEIQQAGMYGDEAMIGAAAEFATYMDDTSAVELMMDTLTNYAAGMSGGGEIDYTSMVDYATNLGKITTGSYDAMTKKGFEFTDAQKAVIDGTATESQYVEALGEDWQSMSDDMRSASVIADVINESWDNLYATMSDTPEAQLQSIKNSFGDIQEMVGSKLYNGLSKMYAVIANNMPMIQSVMLAAADGLNVIIAIISDLIQGVADVATFFSDNWSIIEPIIWGIVTALAAYVAISTAVSVVNGIVAVAKGLFAAATVLATGATWAETTAQMGLNSALYACPLVWIIALVVGLITLLFVLCNWIASVTDEATSGIGLIMGTLNVAWALIENIFFTICNFVIDIFVTLWNFIAAFANFFGNVFNNPIAAVARLFFDLVDTVLSLLQTLASAIDTLFGCNLADSVQGWRDSLSGWVEDEFGEEQQIMATISSDDVARYDHVGYGDAWDSGTAFGDGIADSVSNFSLTDALGIGNSDVLDMSSYSGFTDALDSSTIADSTSETADSTDSIADSLSVTDEELKYLRDIAEQETVNRYTVAEINIDQSGMQNNINSGVDVDGFMSMLTDSVGEAIDSMAEGVHI